MFLVPYYTKLNRKGWDYTSLHSDFEHYSIPCEEPSLVVHYLPFGQIVSEQYRSLKSCIRLDIVWYSALSIPSVLRTVKPCGPRNFKYKQISPCELRLTWLPYGSSIRYFSHTTEAVFTFLYLKGWNWTNNRLRKMQMLYHWATSNLLRCAASVAE